MRSATLLVALLAAGCGGSTTPGQQGSPVVASNDGVVESDGLKYSVLWLSPFKNSPLMEIRLTVENPSGTRAVRFFPPDVAPQEAFAAKLPFRLTDEHGNDYGNQHHVHPFPAPGGMVKPQDTIIMLLMATTPVAEATKLTLEFPSLAQGSNKRLRFEIKLQQRRELDHEDWLPSNATTSYGNVTTAVLYARPGAAEWIAASNKKILDKSSRGGS